MKKTKLTMLILSLCCISVIGLVCSGFNHSQQVPLPEFSKTESGSYPIRELTWEHGTLVWSDKINTLQLSKDGYYCPNDSFEDLPPESVKTVCEHYFSNIDKISDTVKKSGSTVEGIVFWHSFYYLMEKSSDGTVYLHEVGEQPVFNKPIKYNDFIRAAYNFCDKTDVNLVSGGTALKF